MARTAFGSRSVDGHHQRQRAGYGFDTVFQPALDNQFVAFGAHDLFGVGDLRPTQFFSHLRTDLCGIAVDGLPACDDDVGFHVEDGP